MRRASIAGRRRRRRSLSGIIAAALASPVVAAGDGGDGVAFAAQLQPLFDAHCVVCHQYGAAQAGLSLEDGDSHANLVGVKSTESELQRVAPGAPEQSYLLHKLRGTHGSVGGTGARMPLPDNGAAPLSAVDEGLVKTWIEQGAPNN